MSYTYSSQRRTSHRAFTSNRSAYQARPRTNRGPKKAYINPSHFVRSAKPTSEVPYEPTHTFATFGLHDLLKSNLVHMGFGDPTPIQDQTIPQALAGHDIVGIANTGTGKTMAFALPMLHRLLTDTNSRSLIIAPTRELAEQIESECKKAAKNSGLSGVLLIGGKPMGPQLRDLRDRPRIVIGTPGRIKDHADRGTLKLAAFNLAVLDEVDRMLDMGFINDIRYILGQTADQKQSFFFSATLDKRVKDIIDGFAKSPVFVEVRTGDTSDNVDQNVIGFASRDEKIDKLHDVLIKEEVTKTLIFDDTQRGVERLHKELQGRGFDAEAIHGGKNQGQRQRALRRFKNSEVSVLVATDVAARGIDVADITHVINYSTPGSYDDYIHRIGRAGRAGRLGYALTFIEK